MNSRVRFAVCFCFVMAMGCSVYARQSAPPRTAASPEEKTPPSYDMKAQAVLDLEQM
jgi:hypothetical protein